MLAAAVVVFIAAWVGTRPRGARFLTEQPGVVLAGVAVLTALALALLVRLDPPELRLRLDPSGEPLLPARDPGIAAYRRAVLDFGTDDALVVAMEAPDVFTAESLQALRRVTDALSALPGVRDVESLADVASFRWDAQRETLDIGRLVDAIPEELAALVRLRARALSDPLYRGSIVSPDGRAAALRVRLQPQSDAELLASGLDARIRAILDAETTRARRFFVSGRPHLRAQAHAGMVRDLARLLPLAVAVAAALLWTLTRSARDTALSLLPALASALWTHALLAALGRPLNLVTLVLGPTLICVGSVYGVHVLARHALVAAEERDPRAAARRSLAYVRAPVLVSGTTTAAGFAALLVSDVQGTRELGSFAALGVALVTLLSLTAVPALAAQGRPAASVRGAGAAAREIDRVLAALGRSGARRPGLWLALWGTASALAAAALPRIVVDTDFLRFFDPGSRARRDFEAVDRLLGGVVPLYVVIGDGAEGTFRDPANLRMLARVQERLASVPGVGAVRSMADLLEPLHEALSAGAPGSRQLPETRARAAELLLLLPRSELRPFATSNHGRANLIVRTGALGSAAVQALEERIRAVLRAEVPPALAADVTGHAILVNRAARDVGLLQVPQVGLAAAGSLLLIGAALRSWRLALLAMVPNLVPVLLFYGLLAAGLAPLSIPTGLIGSIALGITIDDTVHFIVAYQRGRRAGEPPAEAARRTVAEVGRPVAIASLVLAAGFLVLVLSNFPPLREFGALSALTLGFCLAADLVLLPAVLVRARA